MGDEVEAGGCAVEGDGFGVGVDAFCAAGVADAAGAGPMVT